MKPNTRSGPQEVHEEEVYRVARLVKRLIPSPPPSFFPLSRCFHSPSWTGEYLLTSSNWASEYIYIYIYIFCFIAFSSRSVCLCCMTRLIALYFWDNGVTYCLFSYFVCFVILNWSCRGGGSLIRRFETILWTCSFQVLLRLRMLWNDKPKLKTYQKRKLFFFWHQIAT